MLAQQKNVDEVSESICAVSRQMESVNGVSSSIWGWPSKHFPKWVASFPYFASKSAWGWWGWGWDHQFWGMRRVI